MAKSNGGLLDRILGIAYGGAGVDLTGCQDVVNTLVFNDHTYSVKVGNLTAGAGRKRPGSREIADYLLI